METIRENTLNYVESNNLDRLLGNLDISLEDRVALTALESGKEFTKTVQSNLEDLKSNVHNLASRKNNAYFGTGKNQDKSLYKVLGALRQYQRSKNTYERLQQLCPNHLKKQIGEITFAKNEELLPHQVLQDISSIEKIEKAAQKIGREFYNEKEVAIYEAIFDEIPLEFLKEVFKVGIWTETSLLAEDNLRSLNHVFSNIGNVQKVETFANKSFAPIIIEEDNKISMPQRLVQYIDLEEEVLPEKEKEETEPFENQTSQNVQSLTEDEVNPIQTEDLGEDQNPLFMEYAEIAVEKAYRIKHLFIRIFTVGLQFDESPLSCSDVLAAATNFLIDRCIIWIRKD